MCEGAVLTCPYGHGPRLRPAALDHLASHPTGPFGEVDIKV